MTIPLLIGGATTSKVHTALRIAPKYTGPVIHVLDASRAVGVASTLLSDTLKDDYVIGVAADYEAVRAAREGKGQNALLSLADARANAFDADMALKPPAPAKPWSPRFRRLGPGRACPSHRLDAVFSRMGASRQLSRDPRRRCRRRKCAGAVGRCAGDAEAHYRREMADRKGRRPGCGQREGTGTMSCSATAPCPSSASKSSSARVGHRCASQISSTRATTGWAGSRSPSTGSSRIWSGFAQDHERLFGHPVESTRGSLCRSVRRGSAPARPHRPVGLCGGRTADDRSADPRAISRDPSGTGLSGVSRS